MWIKWLVHRHDTGTKEVVSSLQPSSNVDQQGSKNTTIQSLSDAVTLLDKQKTKQRAPTLHVLGPALLFNGLILSPKCMAWSPCFNNSPYYNLKYQAKPSALKSLLILLLEDVASNKSRPWLSEQQQQQSLNQFSKNYLQIMQELKRSKFNHGHESALELEQLSSKYKELQASFWKRLVPNTHCRKPFDPSSALACDAHIEQSFGKIIASNFIATCIKAIKGGLNGSMEIEVVLTRKRNGDILKELVVCKLQQDFASNVQNKVCNLCKKGVRVDVPIRDGMHQYHCAIVAKGDHDDNVCKIGASSRESIDKESLSEELISKFDRNLLQHYQQHEYQHQDGSECSFGSGNGIGQGYIRKDGSPMSTSSNCHACEELSACIKNLVYNRKEEDGTFWSSLNWCMKDNYMTSHGKEMTWIVRGFEEDDGIFEGNSPNCKDWSLLKLYTNEKDCSHHSDLSIIHFLPIKGLDVEARHGPPSKLTQQASQKQVAKNLREQQKIVNCNIKNGLEMVIPSHKQMEEDIAGLEAKDSGKEEVGCRKDFVDDDFMSIGNMLHCRKGMKLLKEVVLIDIRGVEGDGKIEEPLALISREEIRRCKRRWAKRKGKLPTTTMEYFISMIGNNVKALQRIQKDVAALALKLVELQVEEVKNSKAAALKMQTHVGLLWSKVQGLEARQEFNVLMIFPWQQFLKNIVIGISLVPGTLGLHLAIKSLFRLLFGQIRSVQIATSKKEMTLIVMVILCSGSYIGKEMWQIFSQVQAKRRTHEAIFQEKLRLALQQISSMSTLTYKNYNVHLNQAKDLTN